MNSIDINGLPTDHSRRDVPWSILFLVVFTRVVSAGIGRNGA